MPAESTIRDRNQPDFELIETLRREPDGSFVRGRLHVERLVHSAQALGFRADPVELRTAMEAIPLSNRPLRVRLVLDRGGRLRTEAEPFDAGPAGTVWRLAVASTRLSRFDPLLRHKTSRRDAYVRARAEFPRDAIHEVILLNEDDEVCEGTITSLFVDRGDGGPWLTPALEAGLLPGVLRREMLDQGRAVEAAIRQDYLRKAAGLYVGNSLRGLIPARLAD